MIYLKRIKLGSKFRCFKRGTTFEFVNDVTLLVGDQGCGKSTILSLIQDGKKLCKDIAAEIVKPCKFSSFDCEKDNPRIRNYISDNSSAMFEVLSRFSSHGETLLPILEHLKDVENTLILIDEPETALSITSQYKIVKILRESVSRNCQVIVSTHSPILMEEFGTVFNVEKLKSENYKSYIKKAKQKALTN